MGSDYGMLMAILIGDAGGGVIGLLLFKMLQIMVYYYLKRRLTIQKDESLPKV